MRAICESCDRAQPVDWRPGDFCSYCGQAVRREVRCFWCVKWTPAGKFCRSCSAAVVEETQFPAARMLKDAGTDRFTIPKLLRELDPDQIENFTRLYQRQAVAVARHVDEVAWLERFLQHRHWSAALEDELLPQLPMPEERMAALTGPADVTGTDIERARRIQATSPFPVTRALASLARLALGDLADLEDTQHVLFSESEGLRQEAAISLTHWRIVYGPGVPGDRRELIEELRRSPFPDLAEPRLAVLERRAASPTAVADPDTSFLIALHRVDREQLSAAVESPDPQKRFAAANVLSFEGIHGPVARALATLSPEQQRRILSNVEYRKKPVPELRDAFLDLFEASPDPEVRRSAGRLLARYVADPDVLRIARRGDSSIVQALLQSKSISPDGLERLLDFLIEQGTFRMDQYGMRDAAKPGRLPASFAPRRFASAGSDRIRRELLLLAEAQLSEQEEEALHLFLVQACFGPYSAEVHQQAWLSRYRHYYGKRFGDRGPAILDAASAERYFGGMPALLETLTHFLKQQESVAAVAGDLAQVLRYPQSTFLHALPSYESHSLALLTQLGVLMRDAAMPLDLRQAAHSLILWIGSDRLFRAEAQRQVESGIGTDLDYSCRQALASWSHSGLS